MGVIIWASQILAASGAMFPRISALSKGRCSIAVLTGEQRRGRGWRTQARGGEGSTRHRRYRRGHCGASSGCLARRHAPGMPLAPMTRWCLEIQGDSFFLFQEKIKGIK